MFDRGLGLVSAGPAGRESLLSLIPCLIKQLLHVCVVSVGVAGWNTSAAWFEHVPVFVAGGLAHCWVLRGHLRGVFLVRPFLAWLSNGSFVELVAMVRCWGVVVC